ncbi:EAL domain-containing protein [Lentzea flava]|uniref:Signal transduction protein n=1 Tax=Lentzea flava TaxID=103732 RepID=A0ABQ2V8H2_9PSEU|nr:EAL domain-containing protein [Lentzea flava]MCP2204025.1 PAS domain S-box-containing protein [Lentzea flava]GGU73900.1 signal transduction protein [Lentzea flava]
MDLIGWLLRWIPGTQAHALREVDKRLAAYTEWLREVTWQPIDEAEEQRVLDAILSGNLAPSDDECHGAAPPPVLDPSDERIVHTAEAWLDGLLRSSVISANRTWLRSRLTEFTHELARWLVDPVSARLSPELIGRELAYDLELTTPALRHTMEVLTPFTEELLAFSGAEPERRARLLGGLAEGFTDGARQRVLDEQMSLAEAVDRAHRNQNEALAADAGQFASSFDDSDLGMCLVDSQGVITRANSALQFLVGRSDGPVIGQPLATFVLNEEHARQVEQACQEVAAHRHTAVLDAIEVGHRDNPEPRWASLTITWVSEPGGAGRARVVMADVTDVQRWHSRLDHAAERDDTTDLPNRQCLKRRLDDALHEAIPLDAVGLCVVGLDGLDMITEELGSEVGENFVRLLADRLRGAVGGAVDMVARHDRATFCALITDPAVWSRIDELVAHVIAWLGETVHMGAYKLVVKPRISVVRATDIDDTADQLLARAELMLQQSTPPTRRRALVEARRGTGESWDSRLLADLPAGIDNNELELAYAPLVDFDTGTLVGAEAGLHWRHPDHGRLPIDHLLTLADEIGLDLDLTPWILRTAAEQAKAWRDSLGSRAPFITINVPRRLVRGDRLVENVRRVLITSRVQPDLLRLGLSMAGSPLWHGIRTEHLVKLSTLGIPLRLNDFGSEFERFDLLPQVTFEGIAIPPGLTSRLGGTEPQHQCSLAITSALADMARTLELTVTLQGVDSPEQLKAAQHLRAQLIQGKLAGPSQSPHDIHRHVQLNAQANVQTLIEAS